MSFRKFLLAFSLLAFGASLASQSRAETNNESEQNKSGAFRSYIQYQPHKSHFNESFREVIEAIEKGSTTPPEKDQLQRAISLLKGRELTESRGRVDGVYFLRGFAFEKLGQPREALKAYSQALRERPQSPLYLFRHAQLLKAQGNCKDAYQEFLQVAWQVKQASEEALVAAAQCAEKLGKKDDAERLYAEALSKNPSYPPLLRWNIQTLTGRMEAELDPQLRGQIEGQLRSAYESLLKHSPDDKEAVLALAQLLLRKNQSMAREGNLKRAIELLKGQTGDQAAVYLIRAYRQLGDIENAKLTLLAALKADPQSRILLEEKQLFEVEDSLQAEASKSR